MMVRHGDVCSRHGLLSTGSVVVVPMEMPEIGSVYPPPAIRARTFRMSVAFALAACTVCVLGLLPVRAQPASGSILGCDALDREEARRHYRTGAGHMGRGQNFDMDDRPDEARREFQRTLQFWKKACGPCCDATLRFRMARLLIKRLGNQQEGIDRLKRILPYLSPDQLAEARVLIELHSPSEPKRPSPPGPRPTATPEVPEAGQDRERNEKPDMSPKTEVRVQTSEPTDSTGPEPAATLEQGFFSQWWTPSGVGLGLAMTTAGMVLHLQGESSHSDVVGAQNVHPATATTRAKALSLEREGDQAKDLGLWFGIGGAAIASTTLLYYFLLMDDEPAKPKATVTTSLVPLNSGGGALILGSTF